MTISDGYGGKSIGPAELAKLWAQRVFSGTNMNGEGNSWSMIQSLTTPDSKTLPEVLAATDARGWLAEGLSRLYIVEEFTQRYNGYFQYLDVGPATATGIRINGAFVFTPGSTYGNETVDFQGSVSLRH